MWSDESPFNLFPKCGKVYVLQRPGEEFQRQCIYYCQTRKKKLKCHGLKLCEWCSCGQNKTVGRKSRRRSLLSHEMRPTMKLEGGRESFVFKQDKASVHIAKKNLQFRERNSYDWLNHPPQSLDLNPLENNW